MNPIAQPVPRSLLDLSYAGLRQQLVADGLRPSHAHALWRAVHLGDDRELVRPDAFLPPLPRWVPAHFGEGRAFQFRRPELAPDPPSPEGPPAR